MRTGQILGWDGFQVDLKRRWDLHIEEGVGPPHRRGAGWDRHIEEGVEGFQHLLNPNEIKTVFRVRLESFPSVHPVYMSTT